MRAVLPTYVLAFAFACLQACAPTSPAYAASVTVNPVALAKAVKANATQPNRWHRAVYIAEMAGAALSLGADGGSTEYTLSHARLWNPGCACYVQGARESDPLFLVQGTQNLSQWKLWAWKGALAGAPFAASWVSHRVAPDSTLLDGALVGFIGLADVYYVRAAVHNLDLAAQIARENRAAGH